jgi:hypothetical protein
MRWSPRETDETNREVGAEAVEENALAGAIIQGKAEAQSF